MQDIIIIALFPIREGHPVSLNHCLVLLHHLVVPGHLLFVKIEIVLNLANIVLFTNRVDVFQKRH